MCVVTLQAAHCVCGLASHGAAPCWALVEAGAIKPMVILLKSTDLQAAHLALVFTELVVQHVDKVQNTKYISQFLLIIRNIIESYLILLWFIMTKLIYCVLRFTIKLEDLIDSTKYYIDFTILNRDKSRR